MPYKYIGRTTTFKGKSLWEIVGNLKDFGVGRIVARSRDERYPEPSYMKIMKVETLASPVEPSHDVSNVSLHCSNISLYRQFLFAVHPLLLCEIIKIAHHCIDNELITKF